ETSKRSRSWMGGPRGSYEVVTFSDMRGRYLNLLRQRRPHLGFSGRLWSRAYRWGSNRSYSASFRGRRAERNSLRIDSSSIDSNPLVEWIIALPSFMSSSGDAGKPRHWTP